MPTALIPALLIGIVCAFLSDWLFFHRGYPGRLRFEGFNVELNVLMDRPRDYEPWDPFVLGVMRDPRTAAFCRLAAEKAKERAGPNNTSIQMIIGAGRSARGWPFPSTDWQTRVQFEGSGPYLEIYVTESGSSPTLLWGWAGNVCFYGFIAWALARGTMGFVHYRRRRSIRRGFPVVVIPATEAPSVTPISNTHPASDEKNTDDDAK